MIEIPIYNLEGKEIDKMQVDPAKLGGEIRTHLLKQALVRECAARDAVIEQRDAVIEQIKREAAERIRYLEADAQHLPFARDAFQITCVAFGLRNVTDTDRGIAEMVRTGAVSMDRGHEPISTVPSSARSGPSDHHHDNSGISMSV